MKFGKMKGKNVVIVISLLSVLSILAFWAIQPKETKGSSKEGELKVCKTGLPNKAWLGYEPNISLIASDELKFYCEGKVLQKGDSFFIKKGNLIFKIDSTSLDKITSTYINLGSAPKELAVTEEDKKEITQLLKEYRVIVK